MTVPAKTDSFQDLPSIFTLNGATIIDDQHNPNAGLSTDGIDDTPSSSEKPFPGSGGPKQSMAFWFRRASAPSGFEQLITQYDNTIAATQAFFVGINGASNMIIDFRTNTSTVRTNLFSATGFLYDNLFHRYLIAVNGAVGDVYRDGVALGVSVATPGGGFTGFPATVPTLSLGSTENGAQFGKADLSRLDFWAEIEITAAQALEEFNNEFAAIGEGFSTVSPIISPIMSTIYSNNGIVGRSPFKLI